MCVASYAPKQTVKGKPNIMSYILTNVHLQCHKRKYNYCRNKGDDVTINNELKGINSSNNNTGSRYDDDSRRFKNVNNELFKRDGFMYPLSQFESRS